MSWEHNEKFVLNKLEQLGENQKKAKERHEKTREQVQDNHEKLIGKIEDLRESFDESIANEHAKFQSSLDKQDVTDEVAELEVRQKIIGGVLLVLIAAIMYLHFGFVLMP